MITLTVITLSGFTVIITLTLSNHDNEDFSFGPLEFPSSREIGKISICEADNLM